MGEKTSARPLVGPKVVGDVGQELANRDSLRHEPTAAINAKTSFLPQLVEASAATLSCVYIHELLCRG